MSTISTLSIATSWSSLPLSKPCPRPCCHSTMDKVVNVTNFEPSWNWDWEWKPQPSTSNAMEDDDHQFKDKAITSTSEPFFPCSCMEVLFSLAMTMVHRSVCSHPVGSGSAALRARSPQECGHFDSSSNYRCLHLCD